MEPHARRHVRSIVVLASLMLPWLSCARSPLDELLGGSVAGGWAGSGSGGRGGSQGTTGALRLVAGKLGGPGDLDGIGAAARFRAPFGVATDGAGQLFVTDEEGHVVRQIDTATGAVTTRAGLPGTPGSSDGVGAVARFSRPTGIASDGRGTIFIADAGNQTIRKLVLSTGAVTTLAGTVGVTGSRDGAGSVAQFAQPKGLASDGLGTLFVADSGNHAIRAIDLTTAVVGTLAGAAEKPGTADGIGPAAELAHPSGVTYDRAGNLFVADPQVQLIRQIALATGAVTTIAGAPPPSQGPDAHLPTMRGSVDGVGAEARFCDPTGIASDGAGRLFVADRFNCAIRRIDVSTRLVTTLAGDSHNCASRDGVGVDALLATPTGVVSDGAGNLFVASHWDHTVRKIVVETREVSTVAGSAENVGDDAGIGEAARFSGPRAIASDGQGNLFVADGALRKLVLATGAVTSFAGIDGRGAAVGIAALGVAADDHGNLFVTGGGAIRKVVVATGEVATVARLLDEPGSSDEDGAEPGIGTTLASDGADSLFVIHGDSIRQVVVSTGAVTTLAGHSRAGGSSDGLGTAARFFGAQGIAADRAGNVFVADTGNQTIRKIVIATGQVTTLVGAAGSAGSSDGTGANARFNQPTGIVCDDQGNLYVGDLGNRTLRKIVIATQTVTTVVGTPGRMGVVLGALPAGLSAPVGLAMGPSGELLIADAAEHAILAARF